MALATYSPIIFIGRDQELQRFQEMMQHPLLDPDAQWILSIQGEGGIGKTQLLYQYINLVRGSSEIMDSLTLRQQPLPEILPHRTPWGSTVIFTPDPIDLYLTAHQTVTGLLRALAIKLSLSAPGEPFQKFFAALDRSFKAEGDTPNLEEVFIEGYKSLQADHIVLFFDTIELMNPATQRFFQEIVPRLQAGGQGRYGTLIVTAGRKFLTDFYESTSIQGLQLQGLDNREIKNYLQELLEDSAPYCPNQDFIDRVSQLSQGRPILVALTVDWLNYGKRPEELVADTPEAFERLMIQRILELRQPEDRAILAMSHFKRRCDSGFLEFILKKSRPEAEALIQSITQFSFIKSHYNAVGELTSCLLHDEMQRLITQYVWPIYDPEETLRQEWSEKIQEYYDRIIADSQERYWPLYIQILQQERLYYTLLAHPDRGVIYWKSLCTKATPPDFQEALNQEVEAFRDRLDRWDKQELDYAWANLAYDRGQYRDALVRFEALRQQAPLPRPLEALIRQQLIYCYSHLDDYERGIALGQESLQWFEDTLQDSTLPQGERTQLESSKGSSLNAIGWSYRQQDEFPAAIPYYEQSLQVLKDIAGTEPEQASTKTNLGYLFHLMGKDREAVAHAKGALKLSQRLGNRKQEGLTQNVLGIIAANSLREQQAVRHFQSALSCFEEVGYDRGTAMVKVAYGRLYRQIGWYKVKPDRGPNTMAHTNYLKADTLLDEALMAIQARSQFILAEIYNEKGTLRREQGDFGGAIALYQESLAIAQRIQNLTFQADNAQDMGVAYYLQDNLEQAAHASRQAIALAELIPSPHVLGRAQRTLANVLFQQQDYATALDLAFNSYVNLLTLDPFSPNNSAAIKELLNEEWLSWITEELLENVEDSAEQQRLCNSLLDRWSNTQVGDRFLQDIFPGFGIALEDLLTFVQI